MLQTLHFLYSFLNNLKEMKEENNELKKNLTEVDEKMEYLIFLFII
jgi:hypothetical protein